MNHLSFFRKIGFLFALSSVALMMCGYPSALCSTAPVTSQQKHRQKPWHIKAERMTFYQDTGVILARGGVRAWRGNLRISADTILYDTVHSKVRANGSVVIHMGQDVLKGSDGELNLATQTGMVEGAHLFLKRNNIHLTAKKLWKTGPEEYKAKEATISTCPLPRQAWSIRCRNLRLTIAGNAVAKHTTFNIRNIPVFYSPWVVMPINKYRKTGFLLPYFSTSKRNGTDINIPFFLAINDSMDATFYQHIMSKRGWMEGIEFRHVFSDKDKGIFRFNYLVDTKEDRDYNNDKVIRGNEKRWWLRGKMNQQLPLGFQAKLDVDMVSDRDYLQEFDYGPMGYAKTNKIFKKAFHRSLVDDTDLNRPSTLQITRNYLDSFVASEGRYNDNQEGKQDQTIQVIPLFVLHGFRTRLRGTPFFYDGEISYVNYWREAGTKEQRIHLAPRISMPIDMAGWADLLLSATVEETFYQASGHGPGNEKPDNTKNRLLYKLEADASKTFARLYHPSATLTMRHTIRPRLVYEYRPPKNQKGIPEIDVVNVPKSVDHTSYINALEPSEHFGIDRLEPLNRITFSLLSFLSTKKTVGKGRYAYTDIVRFVFRQNFDIRESIRALPHGTKRRPLSDAYGELEFRPNPRYFLRYDTTYNFYGKGFTTYNLWAHLGSTAGDHLDIIYRYRDLTNINELNLDLWAVISPSWYGIYHLKQSFAKRSELESTYGLRYQSNCWALEGRIIHDNYDTNITIHLELLGIGGWGKGR